MDGRKDGRTDGRTDNAKTISLIGLWVLNNKYGKFHGCGSCVNGGKAIWLRTDGQKDGRKAGGKDGRKEGQRQNKIPPPMAGNKKSNPQQAETTDPWSPRVKEIV
ncbi:hypothetical protein DPMN_010915 [Dreissena polymorpha]|uniref:Uncharacterized protein n=1 Tax=Dreissena polymorpha TaxID=45954 RepID=A0A9D4N538_DREPO|nr:hypothetical protein DPMN_010915 [Dreissena polymorpha]